MQSGWHSTLPRNEEAKPMICQFCQQDVSDPCHDTQEIRQRAMSRIDRCEKTFKDDLNLNRQGPSRS